MKKRVWAVKQLNNGVSPSKVAMALKVSRMGLWKIKQRYEKWGSEGLKYHKPGRLFEPLNNKFYDLVKKEWDKNRCGARKLYAILKQLPEDEQELFSAIGSYSELDEINSLAEVGLQLGDSIEKIKESLLATGYSRKNVEAVLSQFSK